MVVIIGGGLAGMSTAYHLGDRPHRVLEAETTPGGLCRTREIDGFLFDYTGHLLHLRDERAIRLVDELLPDAFRVIERRARIRTHGTTLPFPFQAHLHGLPAERVADCLVGFVEAVREPVPDDPRLSLHDWSLAVFGRGISELFMLPYNQKLFRREATEMTADWVSWAVPRPSLEQVVRGALGLPNHGMGYNPTFRYPAEGGIGLLPRALAERVERMSFGQEVVEVDLDRRAVTVRDGTRIDYETLVVTTPLPRFLGMVRGGPAGLGGLAERLDWSVVACLNLGIDRPGIADGAHWIYFPEPDTPFYRAGFPSNFSSSVAPAGTSSAYVEFGLGRFERFDPERLADAALEALRRHAILREDDRILVQDWIRIDPGYVIFDRARQDAMARIETVLARYGVRLAGRYGSWTYSYMERALLDGLELAAEIDAGRRQHA